jgi:hypothetical protein
MARLSSADLAPSMAFSLRRAFSWPRHMHDRQPHMPHGSQWVCMALYGRLLVAWIAAAALHAHKLDIEHPELNFVVGVGSGQVARTDRSGGLQVPSALQRLTAIRPTREGLMPRGGQCNIGTCGSLRLPWW